MTFPGGTHDLWIRYWIAAGGIVYMSYNTLPGWAAYSPIRHLLVEHANRAGAGTQETAGRIDEAIAFFDRLLAALCLTAGSEAVVALRDVARLSPADVVATTAWVAQVLVDATFTNPA